MGSLAVHLGQQVENEGLHVEVQRLVVQEQLGQQAEVLAVDLGGSGRGGSGGGWRLWGRDPPRAPYA